MLMTQHTELHCQTRRISEKQLEWLLCYGEEIHICKTNSQVVNAARTQLRNKISKITAQGWH